MSEVTTNVNTNNMLSNNYDYSKIFLFGNKYTTGTSATNVSGSDVTLNAGQVMGRIAATGVLVPMTSGAVDGSQFPVGILAETIIIPDTQSVELPICIVGEVAEEKIIFDGADTFDTIVDLKTYRDRIASDTAGIVIVPGTELTKHDN